MYQFIRLNEKKATLYEKLTYPKFRPYLKTLDYDNTLIAIGVNLASQPVGLALAEILTDENSSEILSLFVVPEHRGKGLGKTLLEHLEKELISQGCSQVSLVYISNATTPYLEKILKERQWSNPQFRMLVGSSPIENLKDAPWLNLDNRLPSSYSIFPWLELSLQERKLIQQQQSDSPWYPEVLSPFTEEENIEPINSLGLRYHDKVVGWMVTHQVVVDTIRYTKLFVRKDMQRLGRGIALLAAAIKLQLKSTKTQGIFTTFADNDSMINFIHKHLAPYLTSIRQSWGSQKLL